MESETVKRYTDYGGLIELDCNELSPMSSQILVLASDYDALAAQVRDLREENARLRVENGGLNIAVWDLRGSIAGKVCGLCNWIERSDCYRERQELEQSLATAREEAIRACESERLSLQKIGAVHEADQAYENAITYCQNAIRALKPKGGEKV